MVLHSQMSNPRTQIPRVNIIILMWFTARSNYRTTSTCLIVSWLPFPALHTKPWLWLLHFALTFKNLTAWLSELSKMRTGEERKKLMICSDDAPDKVPDGAVSIERVVAPTSRCPWKLWYWPSQQCRARTSLPVGRGWIRSCQVWLPQVLIDPLLATISGSASSLQLRCPKLSLQKLFVHEEELNKYLKSTTGQVPHAETAMVRQTLRRLVSGWIDGYLQQNIIL